MALLSIFRKNPIEKLSRDKLKEMELRLKVKSGKLTAEVAEIEAQVQQLFQKSKEAKSRLEEISLANRIKTLAQKKDMKGAAHADLEKEIRAVSNLLIVKEHQADLQAAGVWEPLQKVAPEELEKYLIEMKLKAEDRQGTVRMATDLTSSMLKPAVEHEEGLEDILAVMREVREGKLEPEDAGKMVTEEKEQEE
ncbi:hypothetical protein M1O53_01285 [Dehalococcoidia bacterium]|nr:hypothetical protein [Dehalococcoidia bacterium]MCL0093616.1 hypothetical protein [Dehalococcoidia bacterium]